MDRENRLELVKRALRVLVDQLRDTDRVGIVVFGTNGRTLLEPTRSRTSLRSPADATRLASTAGREILDGHRSAAAGRQHEHVRGPALGYEMARRQYRRDAINRIVLCADGVANEGFTGPQSILEHVRTEADGGIHLSTIGFGMGNYNDVLMEQLADKGDGNYYYVDDLKEARRVFVENLTGRCRRSRRTPRSRSSSTSAGAALSAAGFENRDVADRDFRNDKVDAGEIGRDTRSRRSTRSSSRRARPGADRHGSDALRSPRAPGAPRPTVRELSSEFRLDQLRARFDDAAPQFRQDAPSRSSPRS
jgi:Ca-activated chloride channel family protein